MLVTGIALLALSIAVVLYGASKTRKMFDASGGREVYHGEGGGVSRALSGFVLLAYLGIVVGIVLILIGAS